MSNSSKKTTSEKSATSLKPSRRRQRHGRILAVLLVAPSVRSIIQALMANGQDAVLGANRGFKAGKDL
jgi:hypothetical protein